MLSRAALYRNALIAGPVSLPDTDAHSLAFFFFDNQTHSEQERFVTSSGSSTEGPVPSQPLAPSLTAGRSLGAPRPSEMPC